MINNIENLSTKAKTKEYKDVETIFNDPELVDASFYKEQKAYHETIDTVKTVMVCEPRSFSEMPKIVDSIRRRNIIVVDIKCMDTEEAQRSIDFLAGGILAFDMEIEVLEQQYYLITPISACISNSSNDSDFQSPFKSGTVNYLELLEKNSPKYLPKAS